MKSLATFILFFILIQSAQSQSVFDNVDWAKAINDRGLSRLIVESDAEDNIFIASVYYGCEDCFIDYDSEVVYEGGSDNWNVFLAKLDKNGSLVSSRLIGENTDQNLVGFKIDHDGNLIVLLNGQDDFEFSGSLFESGYNLIKFDQAFNILWSKNIKGSLGYHSFAGELGEMQEILSLDSANDIIIGGSILRLVDFNIILDTTILISGDTIFNYHQYYDTLMVEDEVVTVDTNNVTVIKITKQGDLSWVKTFENEGRLSFSAIDASRNNEINLLGVMLHEDWILEGDTLHIDTSSFYYSRNLFVLKMDSSGELIWANRYFESLGGVHSITSDSDGNLIVTGNFYQECRFDDYTLVSSNITSDILVFKVDRFGNFEWATAIGDNTTAQHSYVATNNTGEIFLSGTLSSVLGMVANILSPTGELLDVLNPSQSHNRVGGDLTFDGSGNLILTGLYNGDFVINGITLANSNNQWEEYIIKFASETSTAANELTGEKAENIMVSPNPTQGDITVTASGLTVEGLTFFNAHGQLLYSDNVSFDGVRWLDLSYLDSGVYYLQVQTKAGKISKRVLIQR